MSARKKDVWKPSLSKNLLEMKFMQKSRVKVENKKIESERKRTFEEAVKEPLEKKGRTYIMEGSFVPCEDLMYGRLSFRGQNPDIEKIMRENSLLAEEKRIEEVESKGTISAQEMTNRYSTLIGTINKKFKKKRLREQDEDV